MYNNSVNKNNRLDFINELLSQISIAMRNLSSAAYINWDVVIPVVYMWKSWGLQGGDRIYKEDWSELPLESEVSTTSEIFSKERSPHRK